MQTRGVVRIRDMVRKMADISRRVVTLPMRWYWLGISKNVDPNAAFNAVLAFAGRFLSSRILYYGPKQLYWQYCEGFAEENSPIMTHEPMERIRMVVPRRQNASNPIDSFGTSFLDNTGIADNIEQTTGFKINCGLWEDFLPLELLWACKTPMARPELELFPSWSWASVMGGSLHIPYRINTSLYEHELKAKVAPPQSKEFLTVQGHLDSAGLIYDEMTQTDKFVKILFDTILPQHVDVVALLILDGEKETWKTGDNELYCWSVGLLLTSSVEAGNQYRRVGYWEYETPGLMREWSKIDERENLIQHAGYKTITLV
ncbi:hypothetical protein OEA41_008379 [Lepraria neglecta]|uniref:Uncharacterized protein n=1 Tax=Lepraria neglecta TaxID=209136 RepID=A0AAD9ZFQ1_9LECA|nr:hypothetical protein OEA41_008379 [Lepraria neglecta]